MSAVELSSAQRSAMHVSAREGLPHDPLALVLYARSDADAAKGFAVGKLDAVEISACAQALMLAPSPGSERRLIEPSGSFGGLKPPTHVAITQGGEVYLLDRANGMLKYFDACECAFKPAPCFSPSRSVSGDCVPSVRKTVPLNELRDATGLAISGTDLLIADRGHSRVIVTGLIGLVPRAALRLPVATGLRKEWTPFAIAVDASRRIYVSDPDHARIDVFARDGRWLHAWTSLGAVSHLAVDCHDVLLAVIENYTTDDAGNLQSAVAQIIDGKVELIDAKAASAIKRLPHNRIAVDSAGRLYLGPACAGSPDAVFDAQGYPVPQKDRSAPPLYATSGAYLSSALDSRRRGCVWHRVLLVGALADRTRFEIQTTTSDVELDAGELADLPVQMWSDPVAIQSMRDGLADALVRSPPGRYLWLRLRFAGDGQETPCVSRIVVEFPRVSLRRYLPSVYGMDPTAADFTDRFTSIFDTTLRSIERRIDTLHELFDASSAPADKPRKKTPEGEPAIDFLTWLATWIGLALDRHWPEAVRRALLKRSTCLFTQRGTRYGLWQLLLTFLGFDAYQCEESCSQTTCTPRPLNCAPAKPPCAAAMPPLILEHYRLRKWLFVGAARLGDDAALWGKRIVNRSELSGRERTGNARVGPLDCPPDGNPATQLISTPDPLRDPFHVYAHRFSVFVPARVARKEWQRRGLERLLTQEAPAHTQWNIEYVEPRFRVGVQAMIGLDSVIARTPAGLRLNENNLGRGTVLPPSTRPGLAGINTRVGESTRLQ